MPRMDYEPLLRRMRARGYTQRALSAELGLSESHFSRKLSGQFPFTQREIDGICKRLGITETRIGAYFFRPLS